MATPLTGQAIVTGLASPVPLSATPFPETKAYQIKAPASNGHPIWIGSATVTSTTGHQLDPGDSFEYQFTNLSGMGTFALAVSDYYVVGTAASGDKATWLASP